MSASIRDEYTCASIIPCFPVPVLVLVLVPVLIRDEYTCASIIPCFPVPALVPVLVPVLEMSTLAPVLYLVFLCRVDRGETATYNNILNTSSPETRQDRQKLISIYGSYLLYSIKFKPSIHAVVGVVYCLEYNRISPGIKPLEQSQI